MQRNPWPYVTTFVLAVTLATAMLVAAGLAEPNGRDATGSPGATVTARR